MDANHKVSGAVDRLGRPGARKESVATMTEAQAREAGFTRQVVASSLGQDLNLLIEQDADLDSTFKAFDLDALEMVSVNGWLGEFEDIGPIER